MKVLLTGATGLIGSALTELLLSNGHQVHYLTTRSSQLKNQPNLKGFIWNPSQGTYDRNAFIDVDAIVHLAGASITKPWTKKYKFEILESRINATNTLYKALKEGASPRFDTIYRVIQALGVKLVAQPATP